MSERLCTAYELEVVLIFMYSRVSSLQITRKSPISLQAFVFGHLLTGKFANLSEYCTNLGACGGAVG
jgi:hypothetical protein